MAPTLEPWSAHMLEGDFREMGVPTMWVRKAKGSRSVKCFIQVHFTYLCLHITGTNAVATTQISSAKQERKLCTVRCGSQGSLLLVEETGPTRCHKDTSPHGFPLFGRPGLRRALLRTSTPLLGLPCGVHHSTVSPPVLPRKHDDIFWKFSKTHFGIFSLKKSSFPLRQKVLWQIPAPLARKIERDCLSHSFR